MALEEVLDDIADAGIRFGLVVSSGFTETGVSGATEQERIFTPAANRGLKLLGQDSLGAVNLVDKSALTALPEPLPILPGGRIALIIQSGATAGLLAQQAHRQNIGLTHVVALDNKAMIDRCRYSQTPSKHSQCGEMPAKALRVTLTFANANAN